MLVGNEYDTIFCDIYDFELLFPNIIFPKAVVRRIGSNYFDKNYNPISSEEAINKLYSYSKVVFKNNLYVLWK